MNLANPTIDDNIAGKIFNLNKVMKAISGLLLLMLLSSSNIGGFKAVVEKAQDKNLKSRLTHYGKGGIELPLAMIPNPEKMVERARHYLGTPYFSGGVSKSGMDCSGLVFRCAKDLNVWLPRSAIAQARFGQVVAHEGSLQPGDLLFFGPGDDLLINHTAIYIGNGNFIHMSSSFGCIVSNMLEEHWSHRFLFGTRLFTFDTSDSLFPYNPLKLFTNPDKNHPLIDFHN
jgi:hypothetical protein